MVVNLTVAKALGLTIPSKHEAIMLSGRIAIDPAGLHVYCRKRLTPSDHTPEISRHSGLTNEILVDVYFSWFDMLKLPPPVWTLIYILLCAVLSCLSGRAREKISSR
jgi:hypothetical protein